MQKLVLLLLVTFTAVLTSTAHAVSLGEVDTFSGSVEGWFAGGGPLGQVPPSPPRVEASGGPDGVGDAFLMVSASGTSGPGGRLVAMNATQWAGDYVTAGVTAIAMDLNNFGPSDLTLRLYFEDPTLTGPTPAPPQNEGVTSFSVTLPAGSGWTSVLFPIAVSDLTPLTGSSDLADLLSGTTVIRLYHAPLAAFPGPPITALLGVDNVTAVPEPSTWVLTAAGLVLLGAGLARRRA